MARLTPKTDKHALVFDSGVGGLTVAQALADQAARANGRLVISYAADTSFFPYGDKSDAALRVRLPKVAAALVAFAKPDIFVIACNTASTLALREVRAALSIPVVGTVPAIKPAAGLSQTGTIGLLATPGTLRRAYTRQLIADFAADCRVVQHGSIELVKLAEAAARGEPVSLEAFTAAQAPLFSQPGGEAIDTVVLACTHFPLVRDQLIASAPRALTYIDSGEAIARQTCAVLGLEDAAKAASPRIFNAGYITDDPAARKPLVETFARYGFNNTIEVSVPDGETQRA